MAKLEDWEYEKLEKDMEDLLEAYVLLEEVTEDRP